MMARHVQPPPVTVTVTVDVEVEPDLFESWSYVFSDMVDASLEMLGAAVGPSNVTLRLTGVGTAVGILPDGRRTS